MGMWSSNHSSGKTLGNSRNKHTTCFHVVSKVYVTHMLTHPWPDSGLDNTFDPYIHGPQHLLLQSLQTCTGMCKGSSK